jgi:hypothetical protein
MEIGAIEGQGNPRVHSHPPNQIKSNQGGGLLLTIATGRKPWEGRSSCSSLVAASGGEGCSISPASIRGDGDPKGAQGGGRRSRAQAALHRRVQRHRSPRDAIGKVETLEHAVLHIAATLSPPACTNTGRSGVPCKSNIFAFRRQVSLWVRPYSDEISWLPHHCHYHFTKLKDNLCCSGLFSITVTEQYDRFLSSTEATSQTGQTLNYFASQLPQYKVSSPCNWDSLRVLQSNQILLSKYFSHFLSNDDLLVVIRSKQDIVICCVRKLPHLL